VADTGLTYDAQSVPMLPFERATVVELPPVFHALRAQAPAVRVRTPTGDPAWLVSRYDDVKALLDGDLLSRSHPKPERAARLSKSAILGGPTGDHDTEQEDRRLRRAASSAFSVRRMNLLRPHIQGIVDELLDQIVAAAPPVDLHEHFSSVLPIRVICELLGVPVEDRSTFSAIFEAVIDPPGDEPTTEPLLGLFGYVGRLIRQKQETPGNDFISHVISIRDEHGNPTDDEIVLMVGGLLFAGYHTVTVYLDYGVVLLLLDPAHRRAVDDDDALVDAVEEVLRFTVPNLGVIPRYARRDMYIGDVAVAAGDAVLIGLAGANHDGTVFAAPERLDLCRRPNPHLAFGHGKHFCVGAGLARIQLRISLRSLFQRLPDLRLAVPVDRLRLRREILSGGLAEVPVVWKAP